MSKKLILTSLLVILLLSACSFPGSPAAVPTADVALTLDAARTQAAMTVAAEIASQATATPLPPTATLAPTSTEVPSPTPFPTFTPSNTPLPPTATLIPYTPTITLTNTPTDYNCTITASSPAANASFSKKADFDAKWTLKNTGTQTWFTGEIDYIYSSGEKMQKYNDAYDLAVEVQNGKSVDIIVDMIAPDKEGTFTSTWSLVRGSRTICQMKVTIVVK